MQFVKGGPDVPDHLLQQHEDGRVVFFCGAGISYPACLPGFRGLVKQLYCRLRITPNRGESAAIKAAQFDIAINQLEARAPGNRQAVREVVAEILTPQRFDPEATATHEALLTLSRGRDGQTRLTTTNFDRLFETVIEQKCLTMGRYAAPLLPVPKQRWDGLVYLHGRLDASPSRENLDTLVLSSGDFGLAYHSERWAARFVSELFDRYTVCFIGYSIDDPVMRYMMDALAADRQLGESPGEVFAFAGHAGGNETASREEWEAKSVTPIHYRHENGHEHLHSTVREWAETYHHRVRAKEDIVAKYAGVPPHASTKEDDFVGRLLWALSDRSGLPAKRFADFNPVPSLDWLEPLTEERFGSADLPRFGVLPKANDAKLRFSLTDRPSPYHLAPRMRLADTGSRTSDWDEVILHLAHWLTRHLDSPDLLLWLTRRGGPLRRELAELIERRLDELGRLEVQGDASALARIRARAPDAIPRPRMRTLWQLLVSGQVHTPLDSLTLFDWADRFRREGLTTTSRLELRRKLTPRVVLREPFRFPPELLGEDEPDTVTEPVEWEIVLSVNHVHYALGELPNDERWSAALPELLPDFSALLRDALDLMRELGEADDKKDPSRDHQPSIAVDPQNRHLHDWTSLVELTRDAWTATATRDPERARLAAEDWHRTPYPLFHRLAFFAAAQNTAIPPPVGLDWLLAEDGWWLWSDETKREAIRLLVALAPRLDTPGLLKLQHATLRGPPRDMFVEDLEPDAWTRIRDEDTWLRLANLQQTAVELDEAAQARLDDLSKKHPEWALAEDQSDELPSWSDDGSKWVTFTPTPRRRRELLEWLKAPPRRDHWHEDDWRERCREHFPTTAWALRASARNGVWPTQQWSEALHVWVDEKLTAAWRQLGSVLLEAPDERLKELIHAASWWLHAIAEAKTLEGQEDTFLALCVRVLEQADEDLEEPDDVVGRAINHPAGQATQALLEWWYQTPLEDGQGLPDALKAAFTRVCNTRIGKFRHGRVVLAARVTALFQVDPDWAKLHLLPLFDWSRSDLEARSAWEGFLWTPCLNRQLVDELKPAFLQTAHHYEALGKHARQYATILTFATLALSDMFTTADLAVATRALPRDGLEYAASALVVALEGTDERREDYWTHSVRPYLMSVWPRSTDITSRAIAESLARVAIAAGRDFPEAFAQVHPWLKPIAFPQELVRRIRESEICTNCPEPALSLLRSTIDDDSQCPRAHLKECLIAIQSADPNLEEDPRFVWLVDFLRRHGGDWD